MNAAGLLPFSEAAARAAAQVALASVALVLMTSTEFLLSQFPAASPRMDYLSG